MDTKQPGPPTEDNPPAPQIDQLKSDMLMQQIRDNQNLSMAALGGAAAALAGAVVWATVTVATDWQIGFMAVGIGFLVGWVIRRAGRGIDTSFGIVGAVMSLVGCVLGNYLTICATIASMEEVGIFEVVSAIDLATAFELMVDAFHPMDALFYGLAIYYGYKYSFRTLTEEELKSIMKQ